MSSVSFIITTYNIESYIKRCLESVVDATSAAGLADYQVIIVDDGSSDRTAEVIERVVAELDGGSPGDFEIILLGTNTMGGVGIAANIGLNRADRETVFFVDGDDWINPPGFATAYHEYRRTSPDVLLCDYREHDETNKNIKEPADSVRWLDIVKGVGHVPDTELALPMIAVPWRKFYRRDFIEEHQLRFPECDSFYEDNPFHWDVCLSADDIAFVRTIVCFHRVNRPGQTMGANGLELLAFFDHYERILHIVRAKGPAFEAEATIWLLNQMSWTRQRVAPSFMPAYADAAARALGACDARVWDERVEPWLTGKAIHAPARLVRAGDTLSFVAWSQNERMRDQMRDLSSGLHSLRAPSAHTEDHRIAALAQKIDRIDLAVTKIENYQHASWILGAENSPSTHHELRTATTEEVSDV